MIHTRRSCLIGLGGGAAWLAAAGAAGAVEPKDYLGPWSGVMADKDFRIRVRITISEGDARFYSLDQGAAEFRTRKVDLKPDGFKLEFPDLQEEFTGQLIDANTMKIASKNWGMTFEFKRGDLWAPTPLAADSLHKARLATKAPAMGVAYAKATGRVTVQVEGLRSSEDNVQATAGDRWHIASVTKPMTATLVARMIEDGRIGWDTTIGEILGSSAPDMLEAYKRVTFRHLLSHHAGLQENIENPDFLTFTNENVDDQRAERARYAAFALKQAPRAAPGEQMLYSNNGYVVAGAMLEAVSGQPWEKLIQAQVFAPLGITSAGFGPPGTPGKLDQPLGHLTPQDNPDKRIPGRLGAGQRVDNPMTLGPAGRVHISLGDLIIFLRAHLNRPDSFLKRPTWDTLHTPPFTPGYAMGWYVADDGKLTHGGSIPRWQAYAGFDPSSRTVAAAVANARTLPIMGAVTELQQNALLRAKG